MAALAGISLIGLAAAILLPSGPKPQRTEIVAPNQLGVAAERV